MFLENINFLIRNIGTHSLIFTRKSYPLMKYRSFNSPNCGVLSVMNYHNLLTDYLWTAVYN